MVAVYENEFKESRDAANTSSAAQQQQYDAAAPQPGQMKRFKFATRPQRQPTDRSRDGASQTTAESDLNRYLLELEGLPEDMDNLRYWLSKENQYKKIVAAALDLVSALASQAYVERIFSVSRSNCTETESYNS
jgi:hAT family C-terminal dimerisation region